MYDTGATTEIDGILYKIYLDRKHNDTNVQFSYKPVTHQQTEWYFNSEPEHSLLNSTAHIGDVDEPWEGTMFEKGFSKQDMVNHPPHYQSDNGIECIDAIRAALGKEGFIAYCKGTSIKYLWRDKWDNEEDLKKGIWYQNKAIEAMNED